MGKDTSMKEPLNGIEYLNMLEKENGGQAATHADLAHYLDEKARKAGVPLGGQFELTPLCNFSCRMCYVHLEKEQLGKASLLTTEQWKDLIFQAWKAGMLQATLTGGECLAYPGFKEIYLYLQELGCKVAVLTNGYLLDDEMACFFEKHQPVNIQITLYGWNDDVYERVTGRRAFTTVANNIRNLINKGVSVSLTLTPNRYLGEDALETLRVAYELCGHVTINPKLTLPREETGRTGIGDEADPELYVRLFRLKAELNGQPAGEPFEGELPEPGGPCRECAEHGMKCGGGRSSFAVDWKGNMTFCNSLEAVKCNPLEEGFQNAWKKLNQEALRWPISSECEGCAYRSVCFSCAAYEYQFAGPGKQPLTVCEWTKYLVRHGVKRPPVCE